MQSKSVILPPGPYRLANANVPLCMLAIQRENGAGSRTVDIEVDAGGHIDRVVNASGIAGKSDGRPTIDLKGRQLWAGLVDVHSHLDKAFTWKRAPNPDGTLNGARAAAKKDRLQAWSETDVTNRMDFAIRCALAHGTIGLRTHIDSQCGRTFPSWPVFQTLQTKWSRQIELQGVATLGAPKLLGDYGDQVCKIAKSYTAQAIGPVVYRSENLTNELLRSFQLAEKYGFDLDFHVDETGDPAAEGLRAIAAIALDRRFNGRIVCGHACSLSVQDSARAISTIAMVRDAGIGIVSLPSSNMYLQGRSRSTPKWRGSTLVRELAAAGVPIAIAGDNVADAFNPFADLDLVDAFRDAVRFSHLDQPSPDSWLGAISSTAATVAGMTRVSGTIAESSRANFIIFQGSTVQEVLARCGRDRVIVRDGRAKNFKLPSYADLDSVRGST